MGIRDILIQLLLDDEKQGESRDVVASPPSRRDEYRNPVSPFETAEGNRRHQEWAIEKAFEALTIYELAPDAPKVINGPPRPGLECVTDEEQLCRVLATIVAVQAAHALAGAPINIPLEFYYWSRLPNLHRTGAWQAAQRRTNELGYSPVLLRDNNIHGFSGMTWWLCSVGLMVGRASTSGQMVAPPTSGFGDWS